MHHFIHAASNVSYGGTYPRFINFLFASNMFIKFYGVLTSDALNAGCEITPRGSAKQPCVTKILSHSCILTMSIFVTPSLYWHISNRESLSRKEEFVIRSVDRSFGWLLFSEIFPLKQTIILLDKLLKAILGNFSK